MNFKIDDILNGTVDGITKETLVNVIAEVMDAKDNSTPVEEDKKV